MKNVWTETAADRVAPEILDLARRVSTATLTSHLQKRGFGNTFISTDSSISFCTSAISGTASGE